jgi:cysteine desulfurase
MSQRIIYLDNGATTKLSSQVMKAIRKTTYGNAFSLHSLGQKAKESLEASRKTIADAINAKSKEIIFTSGGTESNNLAIKGLAFNTEKKHIITTKIDHKCVINSCKWLETQEYKVTYLDVDREGYINLDDLKAAITNDTFLVSIIHGHNEIGTIQNLEEIGKITKKHNIPFHTDACQSFTKTELDVNKFNLDLVTLNAHKLHGPKGVGALYVKEGIKLTPLQHGGDQENKLRAGTENIPGIAGFARAVELAINEDHNDYMKAVRDKLINGVLDTISIAKLNGPKNRLINNINFSFVGIEGEALVAYLDNENIQVSTGSACSEKSLESSYVLRALGLSHEEANGSLRITLSRFTTEKDIDYFLEILPKVVDKLKKMSPLVEVENVH